MLRVNLESYVRFTPRGLTGGAAPTPEAWGSYFRVPPIDAGEGPIMQMATPKELMVVVQVRC